jgi:hypothetical protein
MAVVFPKKNDRFFAFLISFFASLQEIYHVPTNSIFPFFAGYSFFPFCDGPVRLVQEKEEIEPISPTYCFLRSLIIYLLIARKLIVRVV